MLEQDVVGAHAQQCHHAHAIYIVIALHSTCTQTLLYYELSLAARAAPSQLCLQDKACSGCSYMMEYYTEWVQQGASEANPPACIYYILLLHVYNV